MCSNGQQDVEAETGAAFRAGYVALAGRPNVGKSTLLNALVGEYLSIVTPLPQTTRQQVAGILTTESYQIVFLDAPGLLEPGYALQEAMRWAALRAIEDADLVAYLIDAARPVSPADPEVLETLAHLSTPVLMTITKSDQVESGTAARLEGRLRDLGYDTLTISALTGAGLDEFREWLVARLPESPALFPSDQTGVQPLRFFAEEFIREACMQLFREELPYSIASRVEEFREGREPVYIRATIYVQRQSQKGIVIGRGGGSIKRVGELARRKIEELLGEGVYLDLRVKVMAGWPRKRRQLEHLGFRLPPESRSGQTGV